MRRAAVGVALLLVSLVGWERDAHADGAGACTSGLSTPDLNAFFGRQVADVVGFDGPVALSLPDGRRLWLGRDAFLTDAPSVPSSSLRPPTAFAHNVGIVQSGNCFTTLHGPLTDVDPGGEPDPAVCTDASYIGRDLTTPCSRWFWPLGGSVDHSGHLAVFLAEMRNPEGTGAAPPASVAAVWLARIDPGSLEVVSLQPAPAPSADIVFGYWVESDATHSYLFGWSMNLFGVALPPSPSSAAPSPSAVYVGRVPVGRFDLAPEYWNGGTWVADRASAAPMFDPGGGVNPMQPRRMGATWVSVVKPGGWFGTDVRVDVAPAPQGPWTTVQRVTVPTRTLDGRTNTYDAHLLPWRSPHGNLVVAISNNAWQMDPLAFDNPSIYRPTFFELEAPAGLDRGASPVALSAPLVFQPRGSPVRVLDSRHTRRFAAGEVRAVEVAAATDPLAAAVAVNLTIVDPDAEGYLTAWACDQGFPATSNVNALAGEIRAAHAVVGIAAARTICVFSSVATDVLVDVSGSYVAPGASGGLAFHPRPPERIFDSRHPSAPFAAGETRRIPVPAGALAVAVNVTVTQARADGYVSVFPCDGPRPVVSNVNMVAGRSVANLVEVGSSGSAICIFSFTRADVVVDLVGTFDTAPDGLRFQPVAPTRLSDTRVGIGTVVGRVALDAGAFGTFSANAPVSRSNIPVAAEALMTSMVAVSPAAAGWGLVAPCVEPAFPAPYGSSTLNFDAGGVVANQSIVDVAAGPTCTFTTVAAHHIVDLVGWFVPAGS